MSDAQFEATVIELQRLTLGGGPARPELEHLHDPGVRESALIPMQRFAAPWPLRRKGRRQIRT